MKKSIGEAKREFWARLFSVNETAGKPKNTAFKMSLLLAEKVGAWSPSEMTVEQYQQAYDLTNQYTSLLKELDD